MMGRGGREGLPQKPSNRDVQIWETVANGDCRIQPGALIAAYCIYFVKETHSAEGGGHFGIQRWLTGLLRDRRCILGDQTRRTVSIEETLKLHRWWKVFTEEDEEEEEEEEEEEADAERDAAAWDLEWFEFWVRTTEL